MILKEFCDIFMRLIAGFLKTCASQLNGHSPFPTSGRGKLIFSTILGGTAVPRRVNKNLSGSEPLYRFVEKNKITPKNTLEKQVVTPWNDEIPKKPVGLQLLLRHKSIFRNEFQNSLAQASASPRFSNAIVRCHGNDLGWPLVIRDSSCSQ